jgi:hypothetical protein
MSKSKEIKLYERLLHSNQIVEGIIGVKSKLGQLSQYCKPCNNGNRIEPFVESIHHHKSDDGLIKTIMNYELEWKSTCKICNRENAIEDKIINHIKLAHYKNCFSCDNCGDFFVSSRAHNDHKC